MVLTLVFVGIVCFSVYCCNLVLIVGIVPRDEFLKIVFGYIALSPVQTPPNFTELTNSKGVGVLKEENTPVNHTLETSLDSMKPQEKPFFGAPLLPADDLAHGEEKAITPEQRDLLNEATEQMRDGVDVALAPINRIAYEASKASNYSIEKQLVLIREQER